MGVILFLLASAVGLTVEGFGQLAVVALVTAITYGLLMQIAKRAGWLS